MANKALFIFGYGYTASRFAAAMKARGWPVTGTVTDADKADRIQKHGIQALVFDGAAPSEEVRAALRTATHVLSSVPPNEGDIPDPVLRQHGRDLAKAENIEWVGYLSSTGVYGDAEGAWVSETSPVGLGRRQLRTEADLAWQVMAMAGLPVHIFRLPGIYGPGRNALVRARQGKLSRVDVPDHVFSRIHVDDIVAALVASVEKPDPGAIYNVADDEPAPGEAVAAYACELLGMEPPPLVPLEEADISDKAKAFYSESRRVSNARLKEELGVALKYPSYREGLEACLKDELAT